MIINPYIEFPGNFLRDGFSTLNLSFWRLYNSNAGPVIASSTGGQLVFDIGSGSSVFELLQNQNVFDLTDRFITLEPISWQLLNVNAVIGIWNGVNGTKRTEFTASGGGLYYNIAGGVSSNIAYPAMLTKVRFSYKSSDGKFYLDYFQSGAWHNVTSDTGNMDPTQIYFVVYPFSFGAVSGAQMIVDNFDSNIPA